MTDPKNPFDFGTGRIDKDQWLRDIDAEQGDFVSQYSSAVNKHRATLMREAFADLRRRIANGDMLNRTADGLYQFGSALSREDKHMQEAYQRALGFMGDLARRQIQAPPAAEPEKKKYSTKTLNERFIKYFNPSGSQESFTSLWNSYDDAKRKEQILKFLRDELNNGLSNYQDVEDYESLDKLKERINEFLSDSNITNLNRLGFNRNYLNLLQTEEQLEEDSKSELELKEEALAQQIDLFTRTQALEEKKQLLAWALDALSYKDENFGLQGFIPYNFEVATRGKTDNEINDYYTKSNTELDSYFKNLAINWRNYLQGKQSITLNHNLSKLFSSFDNLGKINYHFADLINKYFTPVQGGFLLNGTDEENGRNVYYVPGKGFTVTAHNKPWAEVSSLKEGGVLKYLVGGGFNAYMAYRKAQLAPKLKVELLQKIELKSKNPFDNWTKGDYALLGSAAADIASMVSSNVPGGLTLSGILGAGSTITSSAVDFYRNNYMSGLTNLAFGLSADVAGMLPVVGTAAKTAKIAKTIGKLSKILVPTFTAMGAVQASSAVSKIIKGESLTPLEWQDLALGIQLVIGGGFKGAASLKNAANKRMEMNGVTHYDVTLKDGTKTRVTKEEFEGAKKKDYKDIAETNWYGGIKGNAVVTKLGIEKAHNDIVNESLNPFNWSSKRQANYLLNKALNDGYSPRVWTSPNWFRKEFLENLRKNRLISKPDLKDNLMLPLNYNGPTIKLDDHPINTNTFIPKPGETPIIRLGSKLKALRNGGIIKGLFGIPGGLGSTNYKKDMEAVDASLDPHELYYDTREAQSINFGSAFSTPTFVDYTKRVANGAAGNRGTMGNLKLTQGMYMHDDTQNYLSALDALKNYYTMDNGKNIMGDVYNYYNNVWLKDKNNLNKSYKDFVIDYNKNVDTLRSQHLEKFNTGKDVVNQRGWTNFNLLHRKMYGSYGKYKNDKGEISDDWNSDPKVVDILGESTWRRLPNAFNGKEYDALRRGFLKDGDVSSHIYMDNNGHLRLEAPPEGESLEPYKVGTETKKDSSKAIDSEGEDKPIFNTEYKNPNDPTPYIIAGKTAMGLLGNRNIYKNLLDEMPQAPLRDPIDRKLAIVGWQEAIKQGLNQLADLRNATWMQHGSNLLDNLAGMYETEGKGRDIMNDKFMKDSGRQFETALKSWNLDNEDTLYNLGVGDANRKAIADRARMMAQIRAAWRSGDNNIIMGALSDAGNWMMKNYQREADLIDLVKQQQLGSREQFMENYVRNKHSDYDALKAKLADPNTSDTEKTNIRTKIQQWHLDAIKEAPEQWGLKLYNSFHRPGFGGGPYTTIAKDGTKLEVAKLKARSKDNDRYVIMIKDLRTTRSRRRRR